MQVKLYFIIILTIFSLRSFAYECRSKELKLVKIESKKQVFQQLRSFDRQALVEGLLFDLTSVENSSNNSAKKIELVLSYLEESEVNINQRSFFKLLATTSEIETGKPKKLKLDEICEIMTKVNELGEK